MLVLLAVTAAAAACASSRAPMNEPLPDAASNQGYLLPVLNRRSGRADLLVLVSFSGGGKRSAAFAHGVLRGMRDVPVRLEPGTPSTLLSEVDQLAGVSGGSFPAAHFGLHGERSFETFPDEFLNVDINAYIFGTYLLPWNWEWLVNPLYGTNDRMAEIYDQLMFRGATFADLERRGRPQVSINATDIALGVPFAFLPGTFDLLCSDLGSYPIARAVAASNGFPVLFTPITLQNHRGAGCRVPPPALDRDSAGGAAAAAGLDLRTRHLSQIMDRYLDPERTRWVHLMDGGIADNLALRSTANMMIVVQRHAALFAEIMLPIRRILVISVDGQAATDPSLSRQRVVTGLTQIFGAVSGTQIDNYNIETLLLAENELARTVRLIREVRCRHGRVVDGRPCDDVRGLLTRVSLSEYPDEVARARLQAIPTGLTIPREDVETLVQAGEGMVRGDAGLRGFLVDAEPPRTVVPPRRRVTATR
jgi:NTE family protein